jgi:phytoene dehydrogenase-like protein
VISSCDPKRTLLSLLASDRVPSELTHDIRQFRMRGTTAKVHLALSGPLEWAHRPGERFEAIRVAEHLDDLERAYDPSKYRQMSERPHLDIRVPTVSQKGLAPDGHEVVSILVHFTPYALEAGWSETTRDRLKEAVLDRLSTVAPAVRDRLVACQVISPELIEQTYGLTEGHVYHGEHALDQLLSLRPVASCGGHSTPIPGLWLCGSGTHPGGGVTGGPGRLAALDVLAA